METEELEEILMNLQRNKFRFTSFNYSSRPQNNFLIINGLGREKMKHSEDCKIQIINRKPCVTLSGHEV